MLTQAASHVLLQRGWKQPSANTSRALKLANGGMGLELALRSSPPSLLQPRPSSLLPAHLLLSTTLLLRSHMGGMLLLRGLSSHILPCWGQMTESGASPQLPKSLVTGQSVCKEEITCRLLSNKSLLSLPSVMHHCGTDTTGAIFLFYCIYLLKHSQMSQDT